jgi:hypothetical protein
MFAHNKVARGFCSTGISLHWGTSNVIVLTIIVAMLGTMQFAMAGIKPPVRDLPPPGCPDDCPDPRMNIYWQRGMDRHVAVGNALYVYGGVSDTVLTEAGNRMIQYVDHLGAPALANYQAAIVNFITTGQWNAVTLSAEYPWLAENNFWNVATQAWIQAYLDQTINNLTLAERKNLAWLVQQVGIEYVMYEAANFFLQEGSDPGDKIHPPKTIPAGWARAMFGILGFFGALLVITDPIGWIVIGGCVAGTAYMDFKGMIRTIPSESELMEMSATMRRERHE